MLWTFNGTDGTLCDQHLEIFVDTIDAVCVVTIEHYAIATLFARKANVTAKPFAGKQLFTFVFVKFCVEGEIGTKLIS